MNCTASLLLEQRIAKKSSQQKFQSSHTDASSQNTSSKGTAAPGSLCWARGHYQSKRTHRLVLQWAYPWKTKEIQSLYRPKLDGKQGHPQAQIPDTYTKLTASQTKCRIMFFPRCRQGGLTSYSPQWGIIMDDTMHTCYVPYRWLRPSFGISSAPEEFQMRLTSALEGLEGIICITYEILVFGEGNSYAEAR